MEQPIDGFGAADVWAGPLTPAQVTLFFDPVNGIGLSLLRIGIDVNGTPLGSGPTPTRWRPPRSASRSGAPRGRRPPPTRTTTARTTAGRCWPPTTTSWATVLAGFPATFKQNTGVDSYGISAQNEPDFAASYASCIYSVGADGGLRQGARSEARGAEPAREAPRRRARRLENLWGGRRLRHRHPRRSCRLRGRRTSSPPTTTGTSATASRPGHASQRGDAAHLGDGDVGRERTGRRHRARHRGRHMGVRGPHHGRRQRLALLVARQPQHRRRGAAPPGREHHRPPKRLYTLGNYSKFVRPGYVRVGTSGATPAGGVLVSAFKRPGERDGRGRRHQPGYDRGGHAPGLRVGRQGADAGHSLRDVGERRPRGAAGDRGDERELHGHARRAEGHHLRRATEPRRRGASPSSARRSAA